MSSRNIFRREGKWLNSAAFKRDTNNHKIWSELKCIQFKHWNESSTIKKMVVKTSLQWTVLVVSRAQWLSDTVLHFVLYPWGIVKKKFG